MATNTEKLTPLNIALRPAEGRGGLEWLGQRIAPQLAFRRADGKHFGDQAPFLTKVAHSPARVTNVTFISTHRDCAVMTCLVTDNSKGTAKIITAFASLCYRGDDFPAEFEARLAVE